jgi:hypothetical protein
MTTEFDEVRALPFRPRVLPFQTTDSYLGSLAAANQLTVQAVTRLVVAVRGTGDGRAGALSRAVIRRLGALHDRALEPQPTHHMDGSACAKCTIGQDQRLACHHCSGGASVDQVSHVGGYVCTHHRVWIGPGTTLDGQVRVGTEVVEASKLLDRLVARGLVSAALIAEVRARLFVSPAPTSPQTEFLLITSTLRLISNRQFNDDLLDSRLSFAESYEVLEARVRSELPDATTPFVDNIWALYRPVFWRRQRVLEDEDVPALGAHDFDPQYTPRRAIRPLEPFDRYTRPVSEASRPLDKLRWELESISGSFLVQTATAGCTMPAQSICARGHRHETTPRTLARAGARGCSGCPVCAGTVVTARWNSIAALRPLLAARFHPALNGAATPFTVHGNSHTRYIWMCPQCHRDYEAAPISNHPTGLCPKCRRPQRELPRWLVEELDTDVEPSITRRILTNNVSAAHAWRCHRDARHRWQASTTARLLWRSCPYCEGRILMPGVNDLGTLFPNVAATWDYEQNSPKQPEDFTPRSGEKVFWRCAGHSYASTIRSRKTGNKCPYCRGGEPLPGFNTLQDVRPDLVQEWDYERNTKSPGEVTWGSNYAAFWRCPDGHIYQLEVFRRTKGLKGRGCTVCQPVQHASRPPARRVA